MGSININFADVESGFDAIPEGVYPAIVEKVEVRESKSSDYNYLNWEWTLTEGEHEGRKMWQITSLSPKALFRLKDQLIALGVIEGDEDMEITWDDDVEITPGEGPLLLEPDVTGMTANLVVTIEPYKGSDRNRVDEIRSIDDAGPSSRPRSTSGGAKSSSNGAAKKPAGRRALR